MLLLPNNQFYLLYFIPQTIIHQLLIIPHYYYNDNKLKYPFFFAKRQ